MIALPRLLFWFLVLTLAAFLLAAQQHNPPPAQQHNPPPAQQHNPPAAQPQGGTPAQPASGEQAASSAAGHASQEGEHHPASGLREAVFKWINFLALFGLLGYLLRKPMSEFFAGRTRAILQGLEEGRRASEEAAQHLREIEDRLGRVEWEIAELRKTAAGEADAERQRLRAAARAETERILAMAQQEIRALAKAARAELKSYAAGLAVELAEQRIRARLTPERQAALLRGYAASLRDKHV